ncbi:MAG TPA: WG repeat-containing protein [Polyangiaceae bacterium]|nr:WG repeat-containing protein [Polyangiaceae bacterium]
MQSVAPSALRVLLCAASASLWACAAGNASDSAPKVAPECGAVSAPVPPPPSATSEQVGAPPVAQAATTSHAVDDAPLSATDAPLDLRGDGCEPELYPEQDPTQGPFSFQDKDGRFGYKDAKGNVVIPAQLQVAYPFLEQGVGAGVLNDQCVFFDRSGRVIARAFVFDNGPDYFSQGRARIVQDGKLGFIDKSGAVVIPPRFDFATPFCAGRAQVCVGCKRVPTDDEHATYEGGRWWVIDERGEPVNSGR